MNLPRPDDDEPPRKRIMKYPSTTTPKPAREVVAIITGGPSVGPKVERSHNVRTLNLKIVWEIDRRLYAISGLHQPVRGTSRLPN
jgi:hypothetical protein